MGVVAILTVCRSCGRMIRGRGPYCWRCGQNDYICRQCRQPKPPRGSQTCVRCHLASTFSSHGYRRRVPRQLRERLIAFYAARAARGQPLFDDGIVFDPASAFCAS